MVWDSEQYWGKAARYIEMADQPEREPWERPFLLSVAMEFLARAALTKVHPALNADGEGDGLNILYAFGFELKGQPKSLPIHAVLLRLQKILPESFTKPRREFCDFFANLRNQELQTADLAFEGLSESKWLARFYDICLVLCEHLGKTPEALLGKSDAQAARDLVKALWSDKVSAVKSKIAAHQAVFEARPADERTRLTAEVSALSKQWLVTWTKVNCPACRNPARLQGSIERVSRPFYDGEQLLEKVIVRAHRLHCMACGLALVDIDELHVAAIEPHFEYLQETELHDYHEADYYDEYDNM